MISRAIVGLGLLAVYAGAQTRIPSGVLRYDKPGATAPAIWQYIQKEWGWVVSSRPFGRSVAFLVGVGNYQYIEPKLRYVADDLKEMREFLLGSAGFDTVYVLEDAADVNLVENYMFNEFPKTVRAEDRLLFYFTGHGADLAGSGYMQFAKAQPGRYDANQYLNVTRCEQWSRQIPAKHILFIIDACNSGLGYDAKPGDAPRVDKDLLNLFSGDGSRVVMTAGTGSEKSFQVAEGNRSGYSVFTRAFLDAIRQTPSSSGFLTLEEVMARLRRKVAEFSRGSAGRQMTPRLWQIPRATGKDKGTFVFLNPNAKAPRVPSPLKQYVKVTPKDGDSSEIDRASTKQLMADGAFSELKDSSNLPALRSFVRQYETVDGAGWMVELIKERIAGLDGSLRLPEPPPVVHRFGAEYALIPKGPFQMGCSPGDGECLDHETPVHQVTLTRDFYLGRTEVTVANYTKFVAQTKRQPPEKTASSKGEQDPVVNVDWADAQAYCAYVGGRLPTEAEWEYAARGGRPEGRYGPLDEIAWYDTNSDGQLYPVGQKKANAYGLFDMLGNAWEWTADWYGPYRSEAVTDSLNETKGEYRVVRGGGWSYSSRYARASDRNYFQPGSRNYDLGFRCVLPGR